MERLTYDFPANDQHCWQIKGADNALCKDVCEDQGDNGCKNCPIAKAFDRLAAYEDSGLEPEEVEACKIALMGKSLAEIKEIEGIPIERMKVLAKAEAEGRLIVLPCKVGDTVYTLGYNPCHYGETHPDSYDCEGCHDPCDIEWAVREIPVRDIRWILLNAWEIMSGNYFMSREEAEAALKGENHD